MSAHPSKTGKEVMQPILVKTTNNRGVCVKDFSDDEVLLLYYTFSNS